MKSFQMICYSFIEIKRRIVCAFATKKQRPYLLLCAIALLFGITVMLLKFPSCVACVDFVYLYN